MININLLDWTQLTESLNSNGFAKISNVLSARECNDLRDLYFEDHLYRGTIDMQRYRFGKGAYRYFKYPLPAVIQTLREEFYGPLAEVANGWMDQLGIDVTYPNTHQQLIDKCCLHQQLRPTSLILRYEAGGFNTLHQDLYGEVYFPFQIVFVLSEEGKDYEGGEFVLTEQIPRAQSKAMVLRLKQGDALIFTTNFRPVRGVKGYYRATMKHGISEVRLGVRHALGIIFHDAV